MDEKWKLKVMNKKIWETREGDDRKRGMKRRNKRGEKETLVTVERNSN